MKKTRKEGRKRACQQETQKNPTTPKFETTSKQGSHILSQTVNDDKLLRQITVSTQFRKEVESTKSKEWLEELQELGISVRAVRMMENERRNTFARKIGVDTTELIAIENASCPLHRLIEIIPVIDKRYKSTLTEQLQRLAGDDKESPLKFNDSSSTP